ncbi:MAG: hypothetical protein LBV66_02180 [Elusimicrobiota bacterium]|jgi:hypothetical protein|nr:hypothetical protein [Elusimicrobiota bacterium]
MKNLSWTIVIVFYIAGIFIFMFEQVYSKGLDYRVSQLDMNYKKLTDENVSLKIKRDSILSIEKMDKVAKEKNLKRADEKSIVHLNK